MCNVCLLCPCWYLAWLRTLDPLFRNNFQRCQFNQWKILCLKELRFGELSSDLNSSSGCPGNTGMLKTPHLISGQLCLRGLLGARSLGHCSTCRDTDESIDFAQQLQGRSNCSFLELILVHIQPRPFELSFLSANTHLCHTAAAPGFELLLPPGGCRYSVSYLP